MTRPDTLRERMRSAMREQVAAVAVTLFTEHGFDEVTTKLIADTAGVSASTFFRYFPTKEDVLLSGMRDAGERVRDAFIARPTDEPVWESLRIAFHEIVTPDTDQVDAVAIARIIMTTPSIHARSAEKRHAWESLLLPEIRARIARDTTDRDDDARALLAAGLAIVDVSTTAWLRSDGHADAVAILDRLMQQLQLA